MAGLAEFRDLIAQIGKSGANALFPNDFEYYMITFELVDSDNRTVEVLTLPVNPEQIEYDRTPIISISKTKGGTVVLTNNSGYVPCKISINGTFGRKFRLILGSSDKVASSLSSVQGIYSNFERTGTTIKSAAFDPRIKTGYGVIKLLETIIEKSVWLDDKNQPMKLFMYNPTLGHSLLVKPDGGLKLSQDKNTSNAMWRYNLSLTAVAPLDRVIASDISSSLIRATTVDALQKNSNTIARELIKSLG